ACNGGWWPIVLRKSSMDAAILACWTRLPDAEIGPRESQMPHSPFSKPISKSSTQPRRRSVHLPCISCTEKSVYDNRFLRSVNGPSTENVPSLPVLKSLLSVMENVRHMRDNLFSGIWIRRLRVMESVRLLWP